MRARLADPVADFDILFRLREDGFRDHVTRVHGAWDETQQRGYLADDLAAHAYQIIDDDAGAPIACIAVASHPDHDFLDEIIVAATHRGRGLGSGLMRELMERARGRGVPLRLSVLDGNRARALYERLGFRVTSVAAPRTRLESP